MSKEISPDRGIETPRTCLWTIGRLLGCGRLHQATREEGVRGRKRDRFAALLADLRDSARVGMSMTAQEVELFLLAAGQDVELCGRKYGSGHSGIIQVAGRILGTVSDACPSVDMEALPDAQVTDDDVQAVYGAVCQYVTSDDLHCADRALRRERAAERQLRRESAAIRRDIDPEGDDPSNGPGSVGEFWWEGRRAEVQATPWRVLKAVWDADEQKIDVQDLIDEVYCYSQGSTSDVPEGRVKTAMNRANESLVDVEAPLTLRMKNGRVLLETDTLE